MRFAPFIRQRHHITYLFQLRRPPADAKPCAFIKTVPNPSEKTGQLYCGRQCRKQKGATPAQPGADKTASRMVSCAAQGERPTLAGAGGEQSLLSSDHLHNITEVAIHRLEQQLGKPYVWGGTRPDQGFDCSGLVFYAYNKILEAKLRARPMRCITIIGQRLWRITTCAGEICCFSISTAAR